MMPEFTPFRLDTVNQCIWRRTDTGEDERILLTPKAFGVLNHLVEHAGQLVSHRQLLDAVWPRTAIEPQALKRNIFELRRALDDPSSKPRFIETLPRRGYRFIAKVGAASVDTSDAVTARSKPNVVGRDHALSELRQSLRAAGSGRRQIVFITGELGIGKTTLVEELQRIAAEIDPSLCITGGQCVEGFGSREAFYPVLEAVGQLSRGQDGARAVETLATQAPTWLVQFPALLKREHREALQQEILGATRDRMLREICEALESISLGSTLLLFFDDLHWVDYSTIDFISALARRRSPANLMLVATYRPADVSASNHPLNALKSDLFAHQLCDEIALEPLGEPEIVQYLTGEQSGAGLPEGLAALVHRHSEGNPLFMVAVLNHLRDHRLVERENGEWRLRVPLARIDLGVPESLRQMIEAQIDRLGADEQRTLEVASIAGQSFNPRVSAAAADLDAESVDTQCEALARRGLFLRFAGTQDLPDGTVAQRYEFLHALYREVLYGRQAPARRAMLHRRLGERLEAIYATRSSDFASELAHHFEHGSDWPRAVTYLRLAAGVCARRYAPNEATTTLRRALELAAKLPEAERGAAETEVLSELAGMYAVAFDHVRAVETNRTLRARAAHYGLPDVEAQALVNLAYAIARTSAQQALDAIEEALRLSSALRDPLMRALIRARCLVTRIWIRGWDAGDAEDCREALSEIRQSGDRRLVASHVINCSYVDIYSSEYRKACREVVEALAVLMEGDEHNPYLSYHHWVRSSEFSLSWSLLLLGDWGEALKALDAGIARAERNGDPFGGQTLRLYRAWLQLHAMDFVGVREICASLMPVFQHPARTPWRRLCLVRAGAAEAGLGNHERALELLLAAKEEMDGHMVAHDWYCRLQLQWALTHLWLARGDLARAREEGEAFLAVTRATAERTWQALAWEANARIALASLDLDRAQECIDEGLSTMNGVEVPLAAWRVHATAADLSERLGDSATAKHHRGLSRTLVLELASSLDGEDSLRATFLSTQSVAGVLA